MLDATQGGNINKKQNPWRRKDQAPPGFYYIFLFYYTLASTFYEKYQTIPSTTSWRRYLPLKLGEGGRGGGSNPTLIGELLSTNKIQPIMTRWLVNLRGHFFEGFSYETDQNYKCTCTCVFFVAIWWNILLLIIK